MSLIFNRLTPASVTRIVQLRSTEPSELSEYSISYTNHWNSEVYSVDFGETSGCGVIRFTIYGQRHYSPPFGPGDHAKALSEIRSQEAGRLILGFLNEDEATDYAAKGWLLKENAGGADYVYRQSDLAELRGTRYQSKRNHCNRFEKAGNWHYGPLDQAAARRVLSDWEIAKGSELDAEAKVELKALAQDLKTASIGGVLYQDDRPVAFAVGERLTDSMLLCAYEKALADVPGAYQMINREFARREGAGYLWLNRASADGHPLLAKAKESYHPARRLHKFLAIDPFFASSRAWLLRKTPGDLDEIVALWRETFGDDEPFIRSVAETNPGYLVRDEKGLAAMGSALKREKARYVYAFATRPDCRRLGYATAILDAIRFDFPTEPLALVPADEALVPFYECRGFTVSSRTAYVTMTCPEIPGYSVPDPMN